MVQFILIDGNAILHRAYHAMPPLTTSKGELVNAVYGFSSIILKIFETFHPEFVACCFDRKAPTFRKKIFKGYQIKRPKMDDELIGQIARVHQVVETMNIPIFEKDGFEADDVIGTLTLQAGAGANEFFRSTLSNQPQNQVIARSQSKNKSSAVTGEAAKIVARRPPQDTIETIIVTGDRDLLQLVDEHTRVYLPVKGITQAMLLDEAGVKEKMGVLPKLIPDLKGLIGDQSDNYPGVAGVGPKTATELLNEYGSLENIYKALKQLKNKAIKEKLIKGKKDAKLCKQLATIIKDVPVKLDLGKCKLTDYDWDQVAQLFDELEFRSLIPRLPKDIHDFKQKTSSFAEATEDKEEQMGLF